MTIWAPVEFAPRRVVDLGESLAWATGAPRFKVAYDYSGVEAPIYLFWKLETGRLLYARVTPPPPGP